MKYPEITPEIEVIAKLFNGLWAAYGMGQIYHDWQDSGLDKDTIIIHKCSLPLPPTLVVPFREAYKILQPKETL